MKHLHWLKIFYEIIETVFLRTIERINPGLKQEICHIINPLPHEHLLEKGLMINFRFMKNLFCKRIIS